MDFDSLDTIISINIKKHGETMNCCIFTGYLVDDPQLRKHDGPSCCEFSMVTYEYRKNKAGQKQRIPTTLTFEAWASGAETIVNLASKGTKMTVYCAARDIEDVIFRVNEFDFACLDKD
mgnify:FL=1